MLRNKWNDFQEQAGKLIEQESLPADFIQTTEQYYLPLARRIADCQQSLKRPILVGVNGAQGTGKSTLAVFVQALLEQLFQLPCAKFSLDDIYLTKAERTVLAQQVHPLLQTRGVPGTHDLALGRATIEALQGASATEIVPIPAFDKSIDDRLPQAQWPQYQGQAVVVLVEGWCVGAQPLPAEQLCEPINSLERDEDREALWRTYINEQLQGPYHDFFSAMDYLVMLKAPSMDCVLEWRTLQEQKLAERLGVPYRGACPGVEMPPGIMSKRQIVRFVQHYERLTRHMLQNLPEQADEVFFMNKNHQIIDVVIHGQ